MCLPGGGGLERGFTGSQIGSILDAIHALSGLIAAQVPQQRRPDARQLLKWADFVTGHAVEADWPVRVVLGAKFFVMEAFQLAPSEQASIITTWLQLPTASDIDDSTKEAILACMQPPRDTDIHSLLHIHPNGWLQLSYSGVAVPPSQAGQQDTTPLQDRLFLTPTTSMVSNLARIFAAYLVRGPLLLEGPPGESFLAALCLLKYMSSSKD